jgi:hypothetical protein
MKYRMGFCSNSSSSSFIIEKSQLTVAQLEAIRDHKNSKYEYANTDAWDLKEDDIYIKGSTIIDNFDMKAFMFNIGVNKCAFECDSVYRRFK